MKKRISKRFLFTLIALVILTASILLTNQSPLEISGALSILLAPYLGLETLKPSNKEKG